jgi:drug/metabolite transporter (DMT)-like permease
MNLINQRENNNRENVPLMAKIAVMTACLFWAASFIASKTALATVPPLTVVMLRLIVSAGCFFIWMLFRLKNLRTIHCRQWGMLFILSLFGTGFHYGIQTMGINYTTASNASVYAVTGPITIAIIAALFLHEHLSKNKVIGIFLALAGVMIVSMKDLTHFSFQDHLFGDFLVFLSIFMWGIFTVLSKKMTGRMAAVDLTAIITFMGALYMLPIGWLEMRKTGFSLSLIPMQAWLAILFLGITCSFLATFLYIYALNQTESQKIGVYLYTIPPLTYVIAALYLGEHIGLSLILGTLIILGGVWLTEKG